MRIAAVQQAKQRTTTRPEIRNLLIYLCPLYPLGTARRMGSLHHLNLSIQKYFAEAHACPCEKSRTGGRAHDLFVRSTSTANSSRNRPVIFVRLTNSLRRRDTDRLTIGYNSKRENVSKRIFQSAKSNLHLICLEMSKSCWITGTVLTCAFNCRGLAITSCSADSKVDPFPGNFRGRGSARSDRECALNIFSGVRGDTNIL